MRIELDFWFCSRCVEPVSQMLGDVVRPAVFCELMGMVEQRDLYFTCLLIGACFM